MNEPRPASDENPAAQVDPSDLEIFKIVVEHFRNDLRSFWESLAAFAFIQGAAFSVLASNIAASRSPSRPLTAALSVLGVVLSLVWWWLMVSRERFIRLWREQVIRIDKTVDRFGAYVAIESWAKTFPLRRPTNVAKHLPAFMLVVWGIVIVTLLV